MKNSFASTRQLNRLIYTSSIDEFHGFIRAVENLIFPPIGLITSPAGRGKTMAVAYLAKNAFSASAMGFQSSTLLVTIPTAPTNLAIAQTITGVLNDRLPSSRRSANSLSEEIATKLIEYGIERVFFDEADRLSAGTFDFIRMIYEALIREDAEIAFFVIGLPSILEIIKQQEQFASRTIHHSFSGLQEDEILENFLPNLRLDGWQFDPKDKVHLELGSKLWKSTTPSLRRLVYGIETACKLNEQTGKKLSFGELIETAKYASNSLKDGNFDELELEDLDDVGTHERMSRIRNENRNRRNKAEQ